MHGFVARLPGSLTGLAQATYLGGTGYGIANAVAIAPITGDVYVAGWSASIDFPGTRGGARPVAGAWDGVVARLRPGLMAIRQAPYLGGRGGDFPSALAIARAIGDVYVAGETSSTDFPGIAAAARPTFGGGFSDAFVARLTFGLAQVDPSLMSRVGVNQTTFAVGETLVAGPRSRTRGSLGLSISTWAS